MRRTTAVVLASTVAMLLGTGTAQACTIEVRSVEENLRAADAAFVGVVAALESVGDGPLTAIMAVSEVYKGTVPQTASVRTAATTEECGVPFVPGEAYTVVASLRDGILWADLRRGTSDDPRALSGRDPIAVYADGSGVAALVPSSAPRARRDGPVAAALLLLLVVAGGSGFAWWVRRARDATAA